MSNLFSRSRLMIKRLINRKYLLLAGLALALLFMVRAAGGSLLHGEGIGALGLFDVAGAVGLTIASTLALGLLWIRILKCLGASVRTQSVLTFFVSSWPYRYIPGTVPY